jgi:hypothetical protein
MQNDLLSAGGLKYSKLIKGFLSRNEPGHNQNLRNSGERHRAPGVLSLPHGLSRRAIRPQWKFSKRLPQLFQIERLSEDQIDPGRVRRAGA